MKALFVMIAAYMRRLKAYVKAFMDGLDHSTLALHEGKAIDSLQEVVKDLCAREHIPNVSLRLEEKLPECSMISVIIVMPDAPSLKIQIHMERAIVGINERFGTDLRGCIRYNEGKRSIQLQSAKKNIQPVRLRRIA